MAGTPVDVQWYFKKEDMRVNAPDGAVYIARDYLASEGRMVKQFASLSSHTDLVDLIGQLRAEGKEACLYELICYNCPCKLYFDIEWTAEENSEVGKVLDMITGCIDSLLQSSPLVDADPQQRAFKILQSSRSNGKRNMKKFSFHLIYPHIVMDNNTSTMKLFAAKVHAVCQAAALPGKNPIDLSVYTRDRLFRAPLCWKANDPLRTALVPLNGSMGREDILSCFVTNVPGGNKPCPVSQKKIPSGKQTRPRVVPRKLDCIVHLAGWVIDVAKIEKKLQNIIREKGGLGHVQFYRVLEKNAALLLRLNHGVGGRDEPCLAHGIGTAISHKNDNQLITVDIHGLVCTICPHQGKCRRAKHVLCKLEPTFFMRKNTG